MTIVSEKKREAVNAYLINNSMAGVGGGETDRQAGRDRDSQTDRQTETARQTDIERVAVLS